MDLLIMMRCDDGSCCCLNPRFSVLAISLLGMAVSLTDLLLAGPCPPCFSLPLDNYVETGRTVLLTLFQIANTLLLAASIFENAFLVKLYLWFTLSFVVLGLIMSIVDFLCQYKEENKFCFVAFVPEVAFLFVLYRCLPIVDYYRTYLEPTSLKGTIYVSSI